MPDLINMREWIGLSFPGEWIGLSFPGRFENLAGSFDQKFHAFLTKIEIDTRCFSNTDIQPIEANYFLKWRQKVVNKA